MAKTKTEVTDDLHREALKRALAEETEAQEHVAGAQKSLDFWGAKLAERSAKVKSFTATIAQALGVDAKTARPVASGDSVSIVTGD